MAGRAEGPPLVSRQRPKRRGGRAWTRWSAKEIYGTGGLFHDDRVLPHCTCRRRRFPLAPTTCSVRPSGHRRVACVRYPLSRRAPASEVAKASIAALAFFVWAAIQYWPDHPKGMLMNAVAVASSLSTCACRHWVVRCAAAGGKAATRLTGCREPPTPPGRGDVKGALLHFRRSPHIGRSACHVARTLWRVVTDYASGLRRNAGRDEVAGDERSGKWRIEADANVPERQGINLLVGPRGPWLQ